MTVWKETRKSDVQAEARPSGSQPTGPCWRGSMEVCEGRVWKLDVQVKARCSSESQMSKWKRVQVEASPSGSQSKWKLVQVGMEVYEGVYVKVWKYRIARRWRSV